MIRILHVIGAMDRGGAETLIMNLYRTIDRNDIQFDFLVHEDRQCDYDKEIISLGGKIYRLSRFTGFNMFSYTRQCKSFFANHPEYRIVHGHIGSSAAIYLLIAKRFGRFTIAHSHARNYVKGPLGWAFNLLSFPTRYVADYFLGCSAGAGRERFGRNVVGGGRFAVLSNGVDVESCRFDGVSRDAFRDSLGLARAPLFGHVGRFSEEKNHRFLIDVFFEIKRRLPDAVLLLAGRGPLESDLKCYVRQCGLGESIVFLGVCEEVPSLLKALDVFVFPSTNEGLGLAAIESQAAGLPSILSTGVPEEAMVSHLAKRLPLDLGVEAWADTCVAAYGQVTEDSRSAMADEVRVGGFDIVDSVRDLSKIYRDAWKQME